MATPAGVFHLGYEQGLGKRSAYGALELGVLYQRQLSNIYYYSVRYKPENGIAYETSRNWLKGHFAGIELKYWLPARALPKKRVVDPFEQIQ